MPTLSSSMSIGYTYKDVSYSPHWANAPPGRLRDPTKKTTMATPRKRAAVGDALATRQATTPDLPQGPRTQSEAGCSTSVHEPSAVEDECGSSSAAPSMRHRQQAIKCPITQSTPGQVWSVQSQPLKRALPPLARPSSSSHFAHAGKTSNEDSRLYQPHQNRAGDFGARPGGSHFLDSRLAVV